MGYIYLCFHPKNFRTESNVFNFPPRSNSRLPLIAPGLAQQELASCPLVPTTYNHTFNHCCLWVATLGLLTPACTSTAAASVCLVGLPVSWLSRFSLRSSVGPIGSPGCLQPGPWTWLWTQELFGLNTLVSFSTCLAKHWPCLLSSWTSLPSCSGHHPEALTRATLTTQHGLSVSGGWDHQRAYPSLDYDLEITCPIPSPSP